MVHARLKCSFPSDSVIVMIGCGDGTYNAMWLRRCDGVKTHTMPSKTIFIATCEMDKMPATALCADCQTAPGTLDIRTRRLCANCFTTYVTSKVWKRMDVYRGKSWTEEGPRKLLLPLSGGSASLSLLYILDAQLKKQLDKQNRTLYDLILVHIQTERDDSEKFSRWREDVVKTFSSYNFLDHRDLSSVFANDTAIEEDLQDVKLYRKEDEDNTHFLTRLFASLKTATARSDLEELLTQRLLVSIAKKEGCEGILWGHSNSRLAAKSLADVAKGRGGSVPVFMTDGPSVFGLTFNHPMRDLFQVELDLYLKCLPEEKSGCVLSNSSEVIAQVSIRNTSIDDLLTGYIASQGEKYPSLMANVVRTASKLQASTPTAGSSCKLCFMPLTLNGAGRLCYGCDRMKQDIKI